MAKSAKSIDAAVATLEALRSQENANAKKVDALSTALADASNIIVAKAAKLALDFKLAAIAPKLALSFTRLMSDPVKTDRGCIAKQAIAEALYEFGSSEPEIFLTGARHVQLEASFGPPTDTAAQTRAVSLLALVRIGNPRQLEVLADHLMDAEPLVRLNAARAAGYAGNDTAALLLRMKSLAGDAEPEVIAECFTQLVRIQPARSIEFLERFVDSKDETIRQSALLAIGASHHPAGLKLLADCWASSFGTDARSHLAGAIAAHRSNEAVEFLVDRLEQSGSDLAMAIVEAMQIYRRDEAIYRRVKAIVDARSDGKLSSTFARRFA
jgi:HEAT repeat protein